MNMNLLYQDFCQRKTVLYPGVTTFFPPSVLLDIVKPKVQI